MKKVLLSVLAVIGFTAACAQISKDAILVRASSNLNYTSYSSDNGGSSNQTKLDLAAGYFVIDNLTFGVNLGYEKWEGDSDALTTLGVFGRYYINGKVFVGAGYSSTSAGDFSINMIPLELGYAAFINKTIAIEPSITYTEISGDDDGNSLSLNLGFALYFNRGE